MDSIALKSTQFALNRRNCLQEADNQCKYPYSSSASFSCLLPSFSQKLRLVGTSTIVAAAKKENKRRRKEDTHSFIPKPDEATGPFPEAVLLKERKVEEDGRLMPEFADAEERELFEALTLELESDMDVDRMRHYEVVYLIHENHEDEVENVNIKIREFLEEKKGKVWRFSDWGMRRLAYKIQKAMNAHYILMNFELEARWINDFKSMLDRDERVIRHLVMKQDKAETKDCPPPPELHTLRSDMTDDGDEENIDDDEEYDDEDLGEDMTDDGDEENIDDDEEYDDEDLGEDGELYEDGEGIIYVDDMETNSSSVRNMRKPEKVGR